MDIKNFYDIVILPSQEIWDYAIRLGKIIKDNTNVHFVVDGNNYLPHITLYHIAVANEDFDNFCKTVNEEIHNNKFDELKIKGLSDGKSIGIDFFKPSWIEDLERNMILNTNKYYDSEFDIEGYYNSQMGYKMPDDDTFKKYKSFQFGESYQPHITLSVLKQYQDKQVIVDKLPVEKLSFKPSKIAICSLREYWQCSKIIKVFNV